MAEFFNDKSPEEWGTSRQFIEFYQPKQFHITHRTLKRSDPKEPVKLESCFWEKGVKPDDLYDFFEKIGEIANKTLPIKGEFNEVTVNTWTGIGINLQGVCKNNSREELLQIINEFLDEKIEKKVLNFTGRQHDYDESKYRFVHCVIGFIKRPVPYEFYNHMKTLNDGFNPISFNLDHISLVHHTFRTLLCPRGVFKFKKGKKVGSAAVLRLLRVE